jgi:hypothetical protein
VKAATLRRWRLFRVVAACVAGVVLSSCAIIGYHYDDPPPGSPTARGDTLYYRVRPLNGLTMGGYDQLKRSIRDNGVFARVELVDASTARGVTVDVTAVWVPPSLGALVYGYIDLGLLFLLPIYSNSMGYDVQFKVLVDGKATRLYEYPIRRRVFAWLPVLPFIWINAFTDAEEDAFAAVTKRFFLEAQHDGAFEPGHALPMPGAIPGA